ncbi:hypothetical protein PINS_up004467 [Pythium insidiosum]|nr:hypothetical protein PINS_up004467 [Pythium insidiosum]
MPLHAATWLSEVKREIAALTGVEPPHQKLIWRGKELKDAAAQSPPPSGSKIMLLRSQSFHRSKSAQAGASTTTAAAAVAVAVVDTNKNANSTDEKPTQPPAVTNVGSNNQPTFQQPSTIVIGSDANDAGLRGEDLVLVQATRGKATYELMVSTASTLLAVKSRLAAAMGLPHASALRLIVKGKTPADSTPLQELSRGQLDGHAVVKCMVLLDASQHDLLEREDELRVLQNETTQRALAVAQLERRLSRNALPREDALVQLHHLHDDVVRLVANVSLLDEQLRSSKLVKLGQTTGRTSEDPTSRTLRVLELVEQECKTLQQRMVRLVESFGGHH